MWLFRTPLNSTLRISYSKLLSVRVHLEKEVFFQILNRFLRLPTLHSRITSWQRVLQNLQTFLLLLSCTRKKINKIKKTGNYTRNKDFAHLPSRGIRLLKLNLLIIFEGSTLAILYSLYTHDVNQIIKRVLSPPPPHHFLPFNFFHFGGTRYSLVSKWLFFLLNIYFSSPHISERLYRGRNPER